MTLVSGPLSTVTADPTAVSVVQVSVQGPRTAGTGVQTHESKNVAVSGGVFSHEIAPGPATLTMIVGQQPGPPIPILVDDVESQTLADVVDAARLATGETQESLAQFVQQVLEARHDVLDAVAGFGQVEEDALTAIGVEVGKAEGAADRAEDAADRAESAVNDGLGDGAVTLQKLAPDVTNQINSKADLVGGKVPTSQLPEVDLKKQFSVASGAAMMAVSAYAAPITHTHTSAQISDKLNGVWTANTVDNLVIATSGGGFIQTSKDPVVGDDVTNKRYVDNRIPAVVRQEVQGTNGATIFEKRGNVVHVASTGTQVGVTVPTGFRPTQTRRVAVVSGATGNTNTSLGVCTLNPDGSITGGWAAGSVFSYLIQ